MDSWMACRYPRLDSGERRLSSTAALLWSRSGRPSFDFGRVDLADLRFTRFAHSSRLQCGWSEAYARLPLRSAFLSKCHRQLARRGRGFVQE
jgi:hypothetical protein